MSVGGRQMLLKHLPLPFHREVVLPYAGALLAALVCALFLANLALHYPGQMNNDSVNQYKEALSGRYTDWHPPVMSWLWSVLLQVKEGPAPILLLHLLFYWTGFGLIADGVRISGKPFLAAAIALAGAFPPFLYINGEILKDVGMVSAWLAALGILFWFRSQQRRMPLLAAILVALLIAYGTLVRTNAIFGLGPLLLYAIAPSTVTRTWKLIGVTVLAAVLALPAIQVVNSQLFKATPLYPIHSLFMYDLLGVAKHTGNPSLLEPRATLTLAEVDQCYTPFWWDPVSSWGPCGALVHRAHPDAVTVGDGLAAQWLKTIATHPVAYATHRLKHFNSSILFAVPPKHIRLTPEYNTTPPMGIVTESELKWDIVRKNPLVWPVTWLAWGILLAVLLAGSRRGTQGQLATVLVASALCYSGAYLVIGVATAMRYHYWPLIAILIATLLCLPQLIADLRARSGALLWGIGAVALVVGLGVAARILDFQGFV
jgi:hypothetical protein